MTSDAEQLTEFFKARINLVVAQWSENAQMGYDHKMAGRRCRWSPRFARYMRGYMKGWRWAEEEIEKATKYNNSLQPGEG